MSPFTVQRIAIGGIGRYRVRCRIMKMQRGECRSCVRLTERLAKLERQLAAALARIKELEKQLASACKDSSTSSKPPSSDIVKPPRPAPQGRGGRKRKRRRGGQPGHKRHERTAFPPEEVDAAWIYECPESSLTSDWEPLDEFDTIQQVDLVEKLFEVTEHRARLYFHRPTGKVVSTPLPEEVVRAGLVGPRLSTLIAYQKGACHMTYRVIETFLSDVLHLPLSTGQLAKIVRKASAALAPGYEQLQAALPGQPMLNVDETGHPDSGDRLWNWGFHAPGSQGFTFTLTPRGVRTCSRSSWARPSGALSAATTTARIGNSSATSGRRCSSVGPT